MLGIQNPVTNLFVGIWEDCLADSFGFRIYVYDVLDINNFVYQFWSLL